jgi:lipopolysaccharide export system protein LptC
MADTRTLIQRSQAQTQANRYVFALRTMNAKLAEKIRTSS